MKEREPRVAQQLTCCRCLGRHCYCFVPLGMAPAPFFPNMHFVPKGALRRDPRRGSARGKRHTGFHSCSLACFRLPPLPPRLDVQPWDHLYLGASVTASVKWQGQGELYGPEASLFCKRRCPMGSRRCGMEQLFFRSPWFFPKRVAVVYTCVNTGAHAYMFQSRDSPGREKGSRGSRADPHAAGTGSVAA